MFIVDRFDSTASSLFKRAESLPTAEPPVTRKFDDKWLDIFDLDKKEESTKDDLLSKLVSDQQQERKIVITTKPSPPSSQHPAMIIFEPSSITTNGHPTETPTRTTITNLYDFEQAVINLHDGKLVTAHPTTTTTKTSVDSFES